MMSRGWARGVESRGRLNVGSAHSPAAGRSGLGTGRGGTPDLPISPPLAPPALPSSPCCPAAESPRRREPMGAGGGGLGYQSPRGPAGRAHRLAPRLPRACAPRASVVAPAKRRGEGAAGGRAGQACPRSPRSGPRPGVGGEPLAPSPEGQRATAKPAQAARGPPGSPATCDGLDWAARAGAGARERVCTLKLRAGNASPQVFRN